MPSPIIQATIQAAILSATSSILAQAITVYRTDTSFSLDPTSLFRFVLFTVLNTPPNFLWQQALESWFPAYPSVSSSSSKSEKRAPAEKEDATRSGREPEKKQLSLGNTFKKLGLDMTLGASVNTVVFVAAMAGMKGAGWDEIVETVRRDYSVLMLAGAKLWPAVSFMNFTVVPVDRRVVVGSLVGVAWGVYLNLVSES